MLSLERYYFYPKNTSGLTWICQIGSAPLDAILVLPLQPLTYGPRNRRHPPPVDKVPVEVKW